jgi:hypothetical protein
MLLPGMQRKALDTGKDLCPNDTPTGEVKLNETKKKSVLTLSLS